MSGKKDEKMPETIGLATVESAIAYGGAVFGEGKSNDFDAAFDHIVALMEDSAALFMSQSFNTSVFLAITVMEETAKTQVAIYRKDKPEKLKKGRDPLLDHKKKHCMAVLPTVFMGERLNKALGEDVCARLQKEVETEGFTATREAALYFALVNGRFVTPHSAISQARAWELLLLAIETLDDSLVGYTNHSMAKSDQIDRLFENIAALKPDKIY